MSSYGIRLSRPAFGGPPGVMTPPHIVRGRIGLGDVTDLAKAIASGTVPNDTQQITLTAISNGIVDSENYTCATPATAAALAALLGASVTNQVPASGIPYPPGSSFPTCPFVAGVNANDLLYYVNNEPKSLQAVPAIVDALNSELAQGQIVSQFYQAENQALQGGGSTQNIPEPVFNSSQNTPAPGSVAPASGIPGEYQATPIVVGSIPISGGVMNPLANPNPSGTPTLFNSTLNPAPLTQSGSNVVQAPGSSLPAISFGGASPCSFALFGDSSCIGPVGTTTALALAAVIGALWFFGSKH